jgi:hypothetical protein
MLQEKRRWDTMEVPPAEKPPHCDLEHPYNTDCQACKDEWNFATYTDLKVHFGDYTEEEYIAKMIKERANPELGDRKIMHEPPGDGLGWTFLCEICGGCLVDEYDRPVPGLNEKPSANRQEWFGFNHNFEPVERKR